MSTPAESPPSRSQAWVWWVCVLLLLATMINYMDRVAINQTAVRIMYELQLDDRDYGNLESAFAFAFALGAIVVGWMSDRWNVHWIYPVAVLAWSVAGFSTGLVHGFFALLMCRFFLGFAEAANWPCALRTTKHILPPTKLGMGNGILQSGAALGALLTPLAMIWLVTSTDADRNPGWITTSLGLSLGNAQAGAPPGADVVAWSAPIWQPGAWRLLFLVVGGAGAAWVVLWLVSVRARDLKRTPTVGGPSLMTVLGWLVALLALDVTVRLLAGEHAMKSLLLSVPLKLVVSGLGIAGVVWWLLRATRDEDELPRPLFRRRLVVLIVLVVAINICWHSFRAWLPLFLQNQHNYSELLTARFILAYYFVTDIGSLAAGFVAWRLVRVGLSVHRSRFVVFLGCALLTTLSLVAAYLPAGDGLLWGHDLLLGLLLVIGFGALGVFPMYYSFSQELTQKHQGKLTGALGCINWLAMYLLHGLIGDLKSVTKTYSLSLALAGLAPLLGAVVLMLLWGKTPAKDTGGAAR